MHDNRDRYVVLCQQLLAVGAVLAVAVSAAGVVSLEIVPPVPATRDAVAGAGPSAEPPEVALVAAEPVEPDVTEVPLQGAVGDRAAAVSDPQPVGGYATVGVTWDQGVDVPEDAIVVSVRSRDDGDWSAWEPVEYHAEHGPDPGSAEALRARPGTDPVVVGAVDHVQVRIETEDGDVPAGASLAVIDPGESADVRLEEAAIDTADLDGDAPGTGSAPAEETDDGDRRAVLSAAGSVTPKPRIFSRAQWGADERMRDRPSLTYGEVHAGFVHHTVNANGYTRAQVPSLLRGIYAYHTQSQGWSDIGYNFVVDRFGRVWEGRYGGVGRPVVGAHTLGYNESSFAMSALGNFETARAPASMVEAYGRLMAWKLSLHGVRASSRSQRVSGRYFPAISGHSDAGQTACPGRYLYARLPQIRSLAASYQKPFGSRDRTADLAGSRWPDLVLRDRTSKRAFVLRTGGQTGWNARRVAVSGLRGTDLMTGAGDLNRDGRPDFIARDARTGATSVYAGSGSGTFRSDPILTTTSLRAADLLVSGVDLVGLRHRDLVARVRGNLWAYPGTGKGGFRQRKLLSRSWGRYAATAAAGDLDGDGRDDLVARERHALFLVPGLGGRLGKRVRLPFAWGGYDQISGVGDVTRDGRPDLVARSRKTQKLFVFPGDGRGGLLHRRGPYDGFAGLAFLAVNGNMVGNKAPDILGRTKAGSVVVMAHNGRKNVAALATSGSRFLGVNRILNVGDWDGDGHGDVMTRNPSTGVMQLRRGNGRGRFADPVRASGGWGSVGAIAAVGDLTGDGHPDLMGQPRGGAMRIYPGNGSTGFRRSYVARSSIAATAHTGLGLWNGDGSPDTLARRRDGTTYLYPGNGPGGLRSPTRVGSGTRRYDLLEAIGDADGDGRPDLVGWERSEGLLWLIPGRGTGFGAPRLLADGMGRFDLGG